MDKLQSTNLFTSRSLITTTGLSVLYLLLSVFLIGFKTEQLILIGLFNVFYYASETTRKFITGFSIFIVFWIVFDFMKAFPNYQYRNVNIEGLYNAEKKLFGISSGGSILTPNEFFQQHHTRFLDLLSGFFYLCWVPVPLLFAGYLFFSNRRLFLQFALSFFLVNMLGFLIYYVYPAAPPWYVQQYGFRFIPSTPGNTAGLQRFDDLLNVHIFESLYAKSSNVFAAMPSLHSSYPVIVLYYGIKKKMKGANILFGIILLGIWFAAVYTSHHYVLDVLAGLLCAIAGLVISQKFYTSSRGSAFMNGFLKKIV